MILIRALCACSSASRIISVCDAFDLDIHLKSGNAVFCTGNLETISPR